MFKAVRATGYQLGIRVDDLDIIDISALKQHLTQRQEPFGMAWMSALEPALLKRPGVAHILGGLPGPLTSMHARY